MLRLVLGRRRFDLRAHLRLAQEAEFVRGEVPDVREYCGQAADADAEPLRQRCAILVHSRGGDQCAASVGVIAATQRQ